MKRIIFLLLVLFSLLSLVFVTEVKAQSEKEPVSELLYQVIETQNIQAAIAKYKELKKKESQRYDLSEQHLNELGYRLLSENKYSEAVAIFKLNSEMYPQSINVWDSLGEGYLAMGKNGLAAQFYQKTLEMLVSDTALSPQRKDYITNNAEIKLFEAVNFDPPSDKAFRYFGYYGGIPAGKWDMQNMVNFKNREQIKLSYRGHNLYQSPVPPKMEQMLTGENPADVSSSFMAGDLRRSVKQDLIADISDLWKQQGWHDIFPAAFKRMASYEDKQYFVPMAYQWNPIWYRKDIFAEHGLTPPESWEDLLQLCDRLNELGYTPFTVSVQNWPPPTARWFSILNLRLNGPHFYEQVMKGKISYTDERIRNVFIHWRELFRRNAFADSSYQNNYQKGIHDLTDGDAVMYNLGEWIFESPPVREIEDKLDFFPFPQMDPEVTPAEIVHTYGAYMRADNAHPDQSKALLKWLAGKESQENNAKTNSRIVVNMNVDQSLYSDVQKRIIPLINNTEVLVPVFELNTHPDFTQKALEIFQDYWKNPEDIDSAIEKLETARQEVFESSK